MKVGQIFLRWVYSNLLVLLNIFILLTLCTVCTLFKLYIVTISTSISGKSLQYVSGGNFRAT